MESLKESISQEYGLEANSHDVCLNGIATPRALDTISLSDHERYAQKDPSRVGQDSQQTWNSDSAFEYLLGALDDHGLATGMSFTNHIRQDPWLKAVFDSIHQEHQGPCYSVGAVTQASILRSIELGKPGFSAIVFVPFTSYPFISTNFLQRVEEGKKIQLEKDGYLDLPVKGLLDVFTKHYFLYIHPIFPLLNEREFWTLYENLESSETDLKFMSLFVFQAMLFLSCPFVGRDTLQSLGFASIKEARVGFYAKAKMLFEIGSEPDLISRAQGALLLTYCIDGIKNIEGTCWLKKAVRLARRAGVAELDRSQNKNGLKRLWSCCILSDRILSIGLGRQLLIRPNDVSIEKGMIVESDIKDELGGPMVYDPDMKRILMHLTTSMFELVLAFNNALEFLVHGKRSQAFGYDHVMHPIELELYVARLDIWYDKHVAKFEVPWVVFHSENSLPIFLNSVFIYYCAFKAFISRQIDLFSRYKSVVGDALFGSRYRPISEMGRSLRNMALSYVDLKNRGLLGYMSIIFVIYSTLPVRWSSSSSVENQYGAKVLGKPVGRALTGVFQQFDKLYELADAAMK